MAHIPALRGIEQIELAALCTSHPGSAAVAAKAYGIDRAYHNINELVVQPDIDIISTVVRIPNHYEVVMAGLNAGKHVYCEWPLGANLAETEEMAAVARGKGVMTRSGDAQFFSDEQAVPAGCLFVKMRESYRHLGKETRAEIDHAKQEALTVYEEWVERVRAKGEFGGEMPSRFAAIYIDAQLSNALSLLARGEPNDEVRKIMTVAFSMLG